VVELGGAKAEAYQTHVGKGPSEVVSENVFSSPCAIWCVPHYFFGCSAFGVFLTIKKLWVTRKGEVDQSLDPIFLLDLRLATG